MLIRVFRASRGLRRAVYARLDTMLVDTMPVISFERSSSGGCGDSRRLPPLIAERGGKSRFRRAGTPGRMSQSGEPRRAAASARSGYVRRALPRLAARAGLERRVHPHALRHSLATALAHEGKSLPTITAQLGHSSTAVTDRYLAKIAPADLIAQVRDRGRLDPR